MKLVNDNHTNGKVWHDEDSNISVFEDTQAPNAVVFYAWRGTFEDHDTARHSPLMFWTMQDAIDWVRDNT